MNIFNLPRTEEDAVAFLQEKGVLPVRRLCQKDHEMKLYFGTRILWDCRKSTCRKQVNMRTGNWFTDSRLLFVTTVHFFYCWVKEMTSAKFCEEELGINKNTTVDWNNYMREVCAEYLIQQPRNKIGGEGLIVEIDESLFTKRKNNAGRVLPQQWILGGLCRETLKCFLVKVDDRSAGTLMKAILDNVQKCSILYSDSWPTYKTKELEEAGFEHFKVDHHYNFIDPHTGVHTQNVERMWGSAKWRNKRHRGTARHHLQSYLAEFIWKKQVGNDDVFESFLETLKIFWPPESQL